LIEGDLMIVVFAFAENSIQLVPDGTLLLHVLVVVVMIAVLNRTLYRPVNRILEEREQRTKGRVSEAQKALMETERNLARYEQSLREARGAGYHLVEAERGNALASRERALASLREEMRLLVREQKSEIGTQAEQARGTLEQESRTIAEKISAQILARSIGSPPYTS
jgi:F-type H+-transporting ATPase subunit b